MKKEILIQRINEVDPSNQIHVSDLINELIDVIFLKNRITEKNLKKENYIGSPEFYSDHSTLAHYKLKVVSLISTL
jgi:hypothetical protein